MTLIIVMVIIAIAGVLVGVIGILLNNMLYTTLSLIAAIAVLGLLMVYL